MNAKNRLTIVYSHGKAWLISVITGVGKRKVVKMGEAKNIFYLQFDI